MSIIATLTECDAARCDWDVVVIGAGPAGGMAARELARRDLRVLLIDRRQFPRSKVCGACLNQRALSWLAAVGLTNLPAELGAIPTQSFQVSTSATSLDLAIPGGVAVSRHTFDAALVQAAIDAGAEFLPGAIATLKPLRGNGEQREVHLQMIGGGMVDVRVKVVVVADGLGHASLSRTEEFPSRVSAASRVGLGTRIEDESERYPAGTIFMGVGREGYVGVVRVEDGSLNIAAAVDPRCLQCAESPSKWTAEILHAAHLPEIHALPSAAWHGTMTLTRQTLRPAGWRVFVIGDAAGYVEPFTGEGIAWALGSGIAVTPLVARGVSGWSDELEQEWLWSYRRLVRDRQFWCRLLTGLLNHPAWCRAVLRIAATFPQMCRPIVRQLNQPVVVSEVSRA